MPIFLVFTYCHFFHLYSVCVFYTFALLSIISDYALKIFHASEALVMDDRAEKAYKPSLGRRPLPLPLVEYRTLELLPEKHPNRKSVQAKSR